MPSDGSQCGDLGCAGLLNGAPVGLQTDVQEAANVTFGHVRLTRGPCQFDEQGQCLRVVCQRAQFAFGQLQRGLGLVARAQCRHRREVVALGFAGVGRVFARFQVKLRAAFVVALAQRLLGGVLVVSGGCARIGWGLVAGDLQDDFGSVELVGHHGETALPLDRPRLLCQQVDVLAQGTHECHAPGCVGLRRVLVFTIQQFTLSPQRLLAQRRIG